MSLREDRVQPLSENMERLMMTTPLFHPCKLRLRVAPGQRTQLFRVVSWRYTDVTAHEVIDLPESFSVDVILRWCRATG